jgi:hypothetical protein
LNEGAFTCACAAEFSGATCANRQKADGEECVSDAECSGGGRCLLHFADNDDDDYAALNAVQRRFCVSGAFNVAGQTTRQPGGITATDCCDNNGIDSAQVRPNQRAAFSVPISACPERRFDYNCDGVQSSPRATLNQTRSCPVTTDPTTCVNGSGYSGSVPVCGSSTGIFLPCAIGASGGPTACGGTAGGPQQRDCR